MPKKPRLSKAVLDDMRYIRALHKELEEKGLLMSKEQFDKILDECVKKAQKKNKAGADQESAAGSRGSSLSCENYPADQAKKTSQDGK